MANIICENCNGRGSVPTDAMETCGECGGTGRHEGAPWTFILGRMVATESSKDRSKTRLQFKHDNGNAEVLFEVCTGWPYGKAPPAVGSRYRIEFISLDEEEGK